jgi:hypothetical protein
MEKLGRPLRSDEVVRHRDGDLLNNDLGNLVVVGREERRRGCPWSPLSRSTSSRNVSATTSTARSGATFGRARITDVPEYLAPGVYVEETSYRSKSIEGVPTTGTRGFLGSIRRAVDAPVKIAAILVLGVLLGAAAAIALGMRCRRARRDPPTH